MAECQKLLLATTIVIYDKCIWRVYLLQQVHSSKPSSHQSQPCQPADFSADIVWTLISALTLAFINHSWGLTDGRQTSCQGSQFSHTVKAAETHPWSSNLPSTWTDQQPSTTIVKNMSYVTHTHIHPSIHPSVHTSIHKYIYAKINQSIHTVRALASMPSAPGLRLRNMGNSSNADTKQYEIQYNTKDND